MMSDLRDGDKLVRSDKPDSYFEVLDGRVHAGTIHIFDAEKREARYVDEAGIRAGISAGSLVLHRKGMPRVGIAAQYDNPALQARVRLLHDALRRIDAIRAQRGLSFDAAIPLAREAYVKEHMRAAGYSGVNSLYRDTAGTWHALAYKGPADVELALEQSARVNEAAHQ